MSLDANDGESHPGEITKGISWESSSGVPCQTVECQLQTARPRVCRIVPVMVQETSTNPQQRQHEIEAKEAPLHEQPTSMSHIRTPHTTDPDFAADLGLISRLISQGNSPVDWPRKVQEVVDDYGDGDDDGLRDFGAADPSQNVDIVRGKCGEEGGHVEVIQRTQMSLRTE